MKITVNYREIEFEMSTLEELLTLYRFNPERITVQINDTFVPPTMYAATSLKEGDVIDIGRA
ncbi:MAG TPA: sulfur carrier protein ThiS [Spirochaetota bacterium]|nr:sulfur carrier protein ThiS [Spirochaetota bacterium]OPZ35159.1 MAG: sulfur carrier protein ThiS [Spirochaetes bacterium ADurb.BinA120]HNU92771.1 sulfur carrier protein ThiS [Spirochaetota bacterium]HPI15313.1 sulfur carrier protein ThiS [Spirochaetota bacterium]HPO45919.1 sulfur carrier protein ThiS [Spirochaetota bacterium]